MPNHTGVLCGSNLWEWNLSSNADSPDLTSCFEYTVLVWVPSVVLGLSILFHVVSLSKSKTTLGISKSRLPVVLSEILGCFILIVFAIIKLVSCFSVEKNNTFDPKAERTRFTLCISNYVVVILLTVIQRTKGIRTSGSRTVFWVISALCEALVVQFTLRRTGLSWSTQDISEVTQSGVLVLVALGHCYGWKCGSSNAEDPTIYKKPRRSPEESSSLLSKIFFAWSTSFLWLGYKKSLDFSDLWELNSKDTSSQICPRFENHWNVQREKNRCGLSSSMNPVSVPKILAMTFGTTFMLGGVYKLISDLLAFATPQILRSLINFVSNSDNPSNQEWNGFFLVFLILGATISQTLLYQHFVQVLATLGMNARTALICVVSRKSLTLSSNAKKELQSTVGDISNLMSIDVQRVMELVTVLHLFWSAPLQICLAFYFLWGVLGPSSLAGVTVMILLIPFNAGVSSVIKKLQTRQMKYKDKRVKMMGEIISGIKSIKLYAWESFFENSVKEIRSTEIKQLKQVNCLQSMSSSVCSGALILASAVSFITYVLVDEKNELTPEKAFVTVTLLQILQVPMDYLPLQIARLINACIAFKRLNAFMNAEEIPRTVTERDSDVNSDLVVIENGSFGWEKNEACLKNINLRIHPGELVAVVGAVGCGKSTLLSALLGETVTINGTVIRRGKLAYVAQQAWIQNLSLKDNILFGDQLDEERYCEVVEGCALQLDLEMLPAGDLTEIGENGVNLSGGQKQRVSLARAAFSQADLYLLDDPLSAVDAHVGKHIFDRVIGPKGLLKDKTRIMVTHGITHLPQADRIIFMKDGEICESGTYADLLGQRGAFADFFLQFIGDSLKETEADTSGVAENGNNHLIPCTPCKSFKDMKKGFGKSADNGVLVDAEKMETGCVRRRVYWNYFRAVGFPVGIFAISINVLLQGVQMASQLWLKKWSNTKSTGDKSVDDAEQNMLMTIYGVLGFIQSLALTVGSIVAYLGMLRASRFLHDSMLSRILRAPMGFFDTTPLGRIVNRFAADVEVLDSTFPTSVKAWFQRLLSIVSTMIIISISTPWFMAAMIPLAILYNFAQRLYMSTSRQLRRLESVKRSPIYSHFSELLSGSTTIRAYAKEDMFTNHCYEMVDAYHQCYYLGIAANRWMGVRVENLGNVAVFFAGFLALFARDALDAGTVGLSISCAIQITVILNWWVRAAAEIETNSVSIERIEEFLETPQEAAWEVDESRNLKPSWPEEGRIVFDLYETRYREGLGLVLNNASFSIKPNEKVGIVGRTGAGKTSVTNALFRILEASGGRVFVDSKNTAELGLHDIRGRISIIPQDPMLFSGTLRQNLDPFGKYSDNEIWKALELAHLSGLVKCFSAGLSHEISEGGNNLSAGQRQLLCLARALLQHSKILILDEATSCIDLETDNIIQDTIRKQFHDSTVLTIAHRLNTVMDSTRILVLDNGQVKEFDTPANLLSNKDSAFYNMAKDADCI